jgi:alpha-glucosidase
MWRASERGTPVASPLWFAWPGDEKTYGIQTQWLWGGALVVSPVVEDESMDVTFYLPEDVFYDFWTGEMVQGVGTDVTLTGVGWDQIPVHVRGGSIVPLRVRSGMTTAQVRKQNFEILVAPGMDGRAKGELYLDDGVSLDVGEKFSLVEFSWDGENFVANGTFGSDTELVMESIRVLGANGTRVMEGAWSLREGFSVEF